MHLMTQDQYLDVLGGRGSRQKHEPREEHPYKHERDHAAVSGERFVPGPLKPFWSATPRPRTYLLVVDVSTWSADYRLTSSVIWSNSTRSRPSPGWTTSHARAISDRVSVMTTFSLTRSGSAEFDDVRAVDAGLMALTRASKRRRFTGVRSI